MIWPPREKGVSEGYLPLRFGRLILRGLVIEGAYYRNFTVKLTEAPGCGGGGWWAGEGGCVVSLRSSRLGNIRPRHNAHGVGQRGRSEELA